MYREFKRNHHIPNVTDKEIKAKRLKSIKLRNTKISLLGNAINIEPYGKIRRDGKLCFIKFKKMIRFEYDLSLFKYQMFIFKRNGELPLPNRTL